MLCTGTWLMIVARQSMLRGALQHVSTRIAWHMDANTVLGLKTVDVCGDQTGFGQVTVRILLIEGDQCMIDLLWY